MTIKHFRFTVELKANIHDMPKGVGTREEFDRIQRLAQRIAADDKTLIEVYKIIFFDLLFGDYYSSEIEGRTKPKTDKEIILPVVVEMDSKDLTFFTEFFSQSPNESTDIDNDNVLNLFYSQFGKPEIVGVNFELMERREEKN